MLGDWYTLPLSHVVLIQDRAGLLRDPLFTTELLPLLFAEDRLTRRHDRFTLEHLLRTDPQAVQPLIAEYQARRRDPGFRLRFGNPEFDAAVHRIVDPLTAHPAFQVPDPFTAKRSPPGLVRGPQDAPIHRASLVSRGLRRSGGASPMPRGPSLDKPSGCGAR
jgi:hypothetical protein